MINLLPPQKKEELSGERNLKIVLISSINLLTIFICFSLILYSISIFLSGKIEFQEIIYMQKKEELESPRMQALSQNLKIFNQTFSRLDYFYQNQFRATKTLEKISEIVPSEIYLTNLLINPKKEKEKIIESVLTGFSPNRDASLKFKEILEKREDFEEIYFPPASWINPTDINFTVNFKIKWQ